MVQELLNCHTILHYIRFVFSAISYTYSCGLLFIRSIVHIVTSKTKSVAAALPVAGWLVAGWHTGAGPRHCWKSAQKRSDPRPANMWPVWSPRPGGRGKHHNLRPQHSNLRPQLDRTSVGGDIVPLVSWQQIFLLLSSNIFACMVWHGGSCRLSGCEGCWWQQGNCKYLFVKSRTGAHLMIGIMGWLQRYIVQLCAPLRRGAVPWPTKFLAPF